MGLKTTCPILMTPEPHSVECISIAGDSVGEAGGDTGENVDEEQSMVRGGSSIGTSDGEVGLKCSSSSLQFSSGSKKAQMY